MACSQKDTKNQGKQLELQSQLTKTTHLPGRQISGKDDPIKPKISYTNWAMFIYEYGNNDT